MFSQDNCISQFGKLIQQNQDLFKSIQVLCMVCLLNVAQKVKNYKTDKTILSIQLPNLEGHGQ